MNVVVSYNRTKHVHTLSEQVLNHLYSTYSSEMFALNG